MSTDPTMTPEPDMTTHAERIEMWCDLLATAPYAVQDDVPLDDLRAWIAGIRESSRAMAAAMSTTPPGGDAHAEAIRDILSGIRSWHIDPDDDGTADDQLDEIIAHLGALEAALADVQETANAYSAALSMVEDCLTDAVGDDTSVNDIRQSLGLPIRDDLLPPPPDGDVARRDAEARAKRLNDALLIVAAIADDRGKRLSPYSPDTLSEDAQSEMGLHPGDVRRVARPQRGGEQA